MTSVFNVNFLYSNSVQLHLNTEFTLLIHHFFPVGFGVWQIIPSQHGSVGLHVGRSRGRLHFRHHLRSIRAEADSFLLHSGYGLQQLGGGLVLRLGNFHGFTLHHRIPQQWIGSHLIRADHGADRIQLANDLRQFNSSVLLNRYHDVRDDGIFLEPMAPVGVRLFCTDATVAWTILVSTE